MKKKRKITRKKSNSRKLTDEDVIDLKIMQKGEQLEEKGIIK